MKPLLIAAALLATVAAQASVKTDIERQYKRWAKATVANDVDTILNVLAPDYTLKTFTGTVVPRKAYEASLRKRKAANQPAAAYQTQIVTVTVEGQTAKVISDETSTTLSEDPVTNKKLKLLHTHRYLDTWTKIGKAWRLKSTITQQESTKALPTN